MTTVIYTKPGCPYCAAAKMELDARGLRYDEIDVVAVPDARARLEELTDGIGIVPVVVEEDGTVRVGAGGG